MISSQFARQLVKPLSVRRVAASLLLLLMAGDMLLHVGEAFLVQPAAPATDAAVFSAGPLTAHWDESNCPIPGHTGGRFHHHHYPGIITSSSVVEPSAIRRVITSAVAERNGSASLIAHPGRAPPSA